MTYEANDTRRLQHDQYCARKFQFTHLSQIILHMLSRRIFFCFDSDNRGITVLLLGGRVT